MNTDKIQLDVRHFVREQMPQLLGHFDQIAKELTLIRKHLTNDQITEEDNNYTTSYECFIEKIQQEFRNLTLDERDKYPDAMTVKNIAIDNKLVLDESTFNEVVNWVDEASRVAGDVAYLKRTDSISVEMEKNNLNAIVNNPPRNI